MSKSTNQRAKRSTGKDTSTKSEEQELIPGAGAGEVESQKKEVPVTATGGDVKADKDGTEGTKPAPTEEADKPEQIPTATDDQTGEVLLSQLEAMGLDVALASVSDEVDVLNEDLVKRLGRLHTYLKTMSLTTISPREEILQAHGSMHQFLVFNLGKTELTDLDVATLKCIAAIFKAHKDGVLSELNMNRLIIPYSKTDIDTRNEYQTIIALLGIYSEHGEKASFSEDVVRARISARYAEAILNNIDTYFA